MEEKLKKIMSKVFEVSENDINEESSQTSIDKWDSLNQLNLVVELEDEFDVFFEPEEIGKMTTFKAVLEIIKNKQND